MIHVEHDVLKTVIWLNNTMALLDTEVEKGNDFNCVEVEIISKNLKKSNFVVNLFIFY